ncbi:non-ribosomal peptide synthetase, partial [Myxococcus vastator]|uniref:non-ribosomal peptide synthetase n=1 Tax=Myxococcus vastator TaxID=2709664 RepID=UPI0013D4FE7E
PRVEQFAARVEQALGLGQARGQRPALERVEREGALPVSFAQQRLWLLEQLHPGRAVYNVPLALRLRGSLHVEALRRTFAEIVSRHEALRTTFLLRDGQPLQQIHPAPAGWELPVEDLSALEATERETTARRRLDEEARRPFELATGPLLRTGLLRLGLDEHVLVLTMHHIVSDGWSLGVLVREAAALYSAFVQARPSPLPPLPVQYAEFAVWHRQQMEAEGLGARLDALRASLQGAPALELATDFPRPTTRSFRGGTHAFSLPAPLVAALEKVGRENGATLFMVLLAAYESLLARYSGQDDFCIGTPTAHRARPEFEQLIGFFVNTLVLRARLGGGPTFTDLVGRVREAALTAFAHQDVPFDRLVEALGGARDPGRSPLFQAMFVLQNAPLQAPALPGLRVDLLPCTTGTSKFDLTLSFLERDGALDGQLEYSLELFEPATARRMVEHLRVLLEAAARDPRCRVSELSLLTPAERRDVLEAWNDTRADFPADTTFHALFQAQARRTPHALAVSFEDHALTYGELEARSNQLAWHLLSLGLKPEARVGLYVGRGLEMVVGLLGILKAGGAFVPLDSSWPTSRLALTLQDCAAPVLLTLRRLDTSWLPDGVQVVCLDSPEALPASLPTHPVAPAASSGSLAYVIYTSGSTGTPKGVMVQHRSMANLRQALAATVYAGQPPGLRVSVNAPLVFDAAIKQIVQLLDGHCLCIVPEDARQDPQTLLGWLRRHRVDVLDCTPSLLRMVVQAGLFEAELAPRLLVPGGEAIDEAFWRQLAAAPHTRTFNVYGPTECTVDSTACLVRAGVPPSIGGPLANVQVYVLDAHLQPVPPGVPGELFIGGEGVARGYLGRPALTAERFIPHPFSRESGTRLYRTGDTVRWLAGGTLEFMGRNDSQVKVRGFRIELGEVEAALRVHPRVRQALVVVHTAPSGDKRLVAYVVPSQAPSEEGVPPRDAALDVAQLRGHLTHHLPEYMVPAAYVALERLPLNANGKVDRQALPEPEWEREKEEGEERTPMQEVLCGVWASVLGLEKV